MRAYRLALAYGSVPRFSLALNARGAGTPPAVHWRDAGEIRFERSADGYTARLERTDYGAAGMLEIGLREAGALAWAGTFGDARYFYAELPLRGKPAPRRLPKSVALVWDSSASGAKRDHGRELALLDAYFARMREGSVRLLRVRDTVSAPEEFRVAGGRWRELRTALERTQYDGATNLGALAPVARRGGNPAVQRRARQLRRTLGAQAGRPRLYRVLGAGDKRRAAAQPRGSGRRPLYRPAAGIPQRRRRPAAEGGAARCCTWMPTARAT